MVDLRPIAASIGVSPRALAAVVAVESAGAGLVGGRPVIRVEAHLLYDRTTGPAREQVNARFHVAGPKRWEGHTLDGAAYHGHQDREWVAYQVAKGISSDAAVRATSWGLGQVLGAWRELGFDSAEAFEAHQGTETGQVDTMARYIRAAGLVAPLSALDWATVARRYNGPGNVERYAARLAAAYSAA